MYVELYILDCSYGLQVEDHVTECCTVDYIDNMLYMNECTPFFSNSGHVKICHQLFGKKKLMGSIMVRYTFLSNYNVHKSSCGLCF